MANKKGSTATTRRWQWPKNNGSDTHDGILSGKLGNHDFIVSAVREAVQNTIDATERYWDEQEEGSRPEEPTSEIHFQFDSVSSGGDTSQWFSGLEDYREHLHTTSVEHQRKYAESFDFKESSWLKIQDSNTGGLQGDHKDRASDFWNFFLNWGKSNKRGKEQRRQTLGAKGIGRIAFQTLSKLATVFVFTKRQDTTLMCGKAMLDRCIYQ